MIWSFDVPWQLAPFLKSRCWGNKTAWWFEKNVLFLSCIFHMFHPLTGIHQPEGAQFAAPKCLHGQSPWPLHQSAAAVDASCVTRHFLWWKLPPYLPGVGVGGRCRLDSWLGWMIMIMKHVSNGYDGKMWWNKCNYCLQLYSKHQKLIPKKWYYCIYIYIQGTILNWFWSDLVAASIAGTWELGCFQDHPGSNTLTRWACSGSMWPM